MKYHRLKYLIPLILIAALVMVTPALALTESEVEAQVNAAGKEAVTGNVLIWFLCAVGFLKVSQKVDSFISSLGVNVGHTGGSLLAETMVAAKTITAAVGGAGHAVGKIGSSHHSGGTQSGGGIPSGTGFFKGGLIGMGSRHITNSAIKTATANQEAFTAKNAESSDVHTKTGVHSHDNVIAATISGSHRNSETANDQMHKTENGSVINTEQRTESGSVSGYADRFNVAETSASNTSTINSAESVTSIDSAQMAESSFTGDSVHGCDSDFATDSSHGANADFIAESVHGVDSEFSSDSIHGANSTFAAESVQAAAASVMTDAESVVSSSSVTSEDVSTATSQDTHSTSSRTTSTARSYVMDEVRNMRVPSLGGMLFAKSVASGGNFANEVIGKVAQGDVHTTGSMTGERASQALTSYMGYTALGSNVQIPNYSDVEIGGGRIMGTETIRGQSQGIEFGMYHTDQYTKPKGDFTTVYSADGAKWYKQYAQNTVIRQPYTAPDKTIAYHESIVKRLPDPPKRKDRQ